MDQFRHHYQSSPHRQHCELQHILPLMAVAQNTVIRYLAFQICDFLRYAASNLPTLTAIFT